MGGSPASQCIEAETALLNQEDMWAQQYISQMKGEGLEGSWQGWHGHVTVQLFVCMSYKLMCWPCCLKKVDSSQASIKQQPQDYLKGIGKLCNLQTWSSNCHQKGGCQVVWQCIGIICVDVLNCRGWQPSNMNFFLAGTCCGVFVVVVNIWWPRPSKHS